MGGSIPSLGTICVARNLVIAPDFQSGERVAVTRRRSNLFPDSSVVEQRAVNALVGSSSLSLGAIASELKPAGRSPKPSYVGAVPTGRAN